LIELGGGYRMEDLTTYFTQQVGLQTVPTVTSVSVGYATNTPVGNPGSADGEVVLDIEVAAAIAPAARISVYFAPNTEAGFLNAITTATHDMINRPTVMSISWGASENRWSLQAMRAIDAAFYQAAVLGINVFVASGDAGSSDSIADGANHVDFPASSPHAIACGGTNIQVSNGAITSETVWNQASQTAATGGGFSNIFRSFAWQKAVAPYMRGVPDVAGNADPTTGYLVLVDGQHWIMGGTSAVAPLWAALVARIQANLGHRIGYVHERLYANPSALRDITVGNNGSFTAKVGWDACTGLGSPNGTAVQAIF
jgi:kumamolisin